MRTAAFGTPACSMMSYFPRSRVSHKMTSRRPCRQEGSSQEGSHEFGTRRLRRVEASRRPPTPTSGAAICRPPHQLFASSHPCPPSSPSHTKRLNFACSGSPYSFCDAVFNKSPDVRRNAFAARVSSSWPLAASAQTSIFHAAIAPFFHRRPSAPRRPRPGASGQVPPKPPPPAGAPPAARSLRRQARRGRRGAAADPRPAPGPGPCPGPFGRPRRRRRRGPVAMSGARGALGLSLRAARPGWLWGAAAALLALGALLGAWRWAGGRRRRRRRLQRVGTVLSLFVYPVKSCRGVAVRRAQVTPMGLRSGELRDRYGGARRGAPGRPEPGAGPAAVGPGSGSAFVRCGVRHRP